MKMVFYAEHLTKKQSVLGIYRKFPTDGNRSIFGWADRFFYQAEDKNDVGFGELVSLPQFLVRHLFLRVSSFSYFLLVSPRYIDAKEPISEKLLFLSPFRSRKEAYPPKTSHGERRYFKSGPLLDYLQCKKHKIKRHGNFKSLT